MRSVVCFLLLSMVLARPSVAKLRVVTTVETLADLTRKVGGDRVDVVSLGRGYVDPHFVEAKPNLVLALNRTDLLIHVGLELEIGWLPPLVLGARNDRIQPGQPGNLDASTVIPVLDAVTTKVDRSMGDIHPMGNPHYWIPPSNAVLIAREIANRLRALDGAESAVYDRNERAFEAEIARRLPAWEAKAAVLRGVKVVTYHKSWTYVSRWLGLVEVGYLEPKPGIPPSPSHIAELIAQMVREGVKLVLLESFFPRSTADLVAQKTQARTVVMASDVGARPDIKDYFALVDAVIQALVDAAR